MRLLILVMLVVFVSCNQTDKKNITGAS